MTAIPQQFDKSMQKTHSRGVIRNEEVVGTSQVPEGLKPVAGQGPQGILESHMNDAKLESYVQ